MSARKVQGKPNPEWVRVGETLRGFREARGLRVGELAAQTRPPISYSYLSNIEAGRKPLTQRLAAQLAELLGVRQAALIRPDHFADQPGFQNGETGRSGAAANGATASAASATTTDERASA